MTPKTIVLLGILLSATARTVAASSCKLIPSDTTWPAPDVWTKALPGVVSIKKDPEGPKRPNYLLTATKIEHVQAAVKFAAEHNIRLAIINSGVDFLGR
jgi:hypothetical protein